MKKPFINKEELENIIKEFPTPFHIYDEVGIRENARKLKEAFAWNKGFKEYFAVKATPNPYILKILQEEGCGVDCASLTELMMAEALGFTGKDIMFSSNATPREEFEKALDLGVFINLDDYTHIDYLSEIGELPETMFCRYNPGGVFETANGIMDNPGDAKFGQTKEQIIDGFKKMKSMGVKYFGIHSFLASNTISNDYYPELARILFELAVEISEKADVEIKYINLSGGIGVPYKPEEEANDIMIIGEGVRKAFEDILVPVGMEDLSIFTELGRFMLAPYGHLVGRAVHEKNIYKNYIGLDTSAVDLMRPAMYGSYHHITVMGKEDDPADHKYDVTGSLCENNDKFAVDRILPKIEIGDLLVIHDTGAHGQSMGYNYNGKLRAGELLLQEDRTAKLIRRAQTAQDYFSGFDFSDILKDIKY